MALIMDFKFLQLVVMLTLVEYSMAGLLPSTQEWIEYDGSYLQLSADKRVTTSAPKVHNNYWLKIKGGKSPVVYQNIVIDTAKQTETFHIYPSASVEEAIIFTDFTKNLTIIKLPQKNLCFLKNERPLAQAPNQMMKNLQKASNGTNTTMTIGKIERLSWKASNTPVNHTQLSQPMQKLCFNTPIYAVRKMTNQMKTKSIQQDEARLNSRRAICGYVCKIYTIQYCTYVVNGRCVRFVSLEQTRCSPVIC